MDKIKNILNPGKAQDDQTLYGSGQTTGTATGNTAGLSGEGSHFGNNRDTTTGNTSGLTGAQTSGVTNTGAVVGNTTTSGHHIGRDATAIGGGYAVGGPHNTDTANRLDPSVNTRGTGGLEDAHQHSATQGGGSEAADKHHLGRDAAVGVGGIGLAEHEHHKHQNEHNGYATGANSGVGQSATGNYDNTTGSSGHHLGRDAAVGAGGVGLAEHEHRKHEQGASGVGSNLPGPAPNTAGPHKLDWLNKLDPRVNANPEGPQTTGHGPFKVDSATAATGKPYDPTTGYTANPAHHGIQSVPDGSHGGSSHLGRDAAGAGIVGAGAYEADKHHHNKHDQTLGQTGNSGITGRSTTTAGPHSSNIANKADPTADSDRSKNHHYGRDAAITGGLGGAAYEADKHHKHDKDLTAAEREQKREHKHELKEERREHKEEKKGGLLSYLHHDKDKKYSPEEEAEFHRQEREHNSHKGRDALGGAAVGTGAYEAEKHHHAHQNTASGLDDTNTNKPLPTAPGNHGIGTGVGTQNALAGDNSTTGQSSHHLGRDAALVGGAGAVGVHEHDKHHQAGVVPLAEKPPGTDLGDKLHGVERNRGVPDATSFPRSEGYRAGTDTIGTSHQGHHLGRDAALGAGGVGLAEHEHRKHEGIGAKQTQYDSLPTGTGAGQTETIGTSHHLGHDAAVGAGGVGLAEHENRKHEGTSSGLTGSNQGYDNTTSSGLTGSNQGQHHYGRDAAGLGAAGVIGEHEYRKHNATSGQHSGLTGSEFGNTSTATGPNQPIVGDERNRLHKEPPLGHPAAQAGGAHVPASGSERERLVGQGEQRLDGQTVVGNSHVQGGVNAASNY